MVDSMNRARYASNTLKLLDKLERGLQTRLIAEFSRVAKEASAAYPSLNSAVKAHELRIKRLLITHGLVTAKEFASRSKLIERRKRKVLVTQSKADRKKGILTEAQLEDRLAEIVDERALQHAVDISRRTKETLSNIIEDGTVGAEGPRTIAEAILEKLPGMSRYRALTIARTETHSIAMQAELESISSDPDLEGTEMQKTWISSADDRTRTDHINVNDTSVGLDETFTVGDSELLYPGDPEGPPEQVINCRCVLVYSVK
jgi:hypothetical protein